MKKVTIEPGCTTCGLCEFIEPDVFEVTDISHVKPEADLEQHKEGIKEAAQACPVKVITYDPFDTPANPSTLAATQDRLNKKVGQNGD